MGNSLPLLWNTVAKSCTTVSQETVLRNDCPSTNCEIARGGMTAPEFRSAVDSHSHREGETTDTLIKSENKKNTSGHRGKKSDMLVMILSAMYAKLLVVMGIAFPIAQVISPLINPSFQKAFHLFLYVVSIVFLVYAYAFLMKGRQPAVIGTISRFLSTRKKIIANSKEPLDIELSIVNTRYHHHARNCGSFYLRVGAVAFSIGSMIYTGLEIVQFFELDPNSECYSILDVINPISHMAFTFIQLYFIFLNAKMCISKYQKIARLGLMHLVATNLCVWLLAVIQESKHEIVAFYENLEAHGGLSEPLPFSLGHKHDSHGLDLLSNESNWETTMKPNEIIREIGAHSKCRRANIIGQLVQKASPFLFPCTIEYSLICAAICYIMWKNIGKPVRRLSDMNSISGRRHHHYRVDCSNAIKGLFTGIFVLVLAIISVIVFFVLINRPEFHNLALMESHITELVLFSLTSIAPLIAMYRIRHFRYSRHRNVELDNILLIVAQTGVYLFSIFSIISGYFRHNQNTSVVLMSSLSRLVQATVQTVFILDASQRNASTSEHAHKKPGREIITFLLVCNFAMWIINTLKTGRTESSPVQLKFYGFWGWTIVARVSTPLAIFFRFHSTVCLCEIWKKLYKQKADPSQVQV